MSLSSAHVFKPGDLFAERYRLRMPIGQGSSSEVWEAIDERGAATPTVVALKIALADVEPVRIRREIAFLRRLRIPGVVALLDDGMEGDRCFIVMERVVGSPFPGASSRVSWEKIEGMTLALLALLDLVHSEGAVHCDLKPANVLIDDSGRPVLVDFGIACSVVSRTHWFSRTDRTSGTPPYMSPEQHAGSARLGPETDLYAVGVMVREALCETEVPPRARAFYEALAHEDPSRRPRSARAAIDAYRGRTTPVFSHLATGSDTCLTHTELRALFAGDDRLLHLREDAARVLLNQTGGRIGRVHATLNWWVLAGVVRTDGERYTITRDVLDWLEGTDPMHGEFEASPERNDTFEAELLRWISLSWPHGTLPRLATWMDEPEEAVAAVVHRLESESVVWRRDDGVLTLIEGRASHLDWDTEHRVWAIATIVDSLIPGTPGRSDHLRSLEGERDPRALRAEIVEETLCEAQTFLRRGDLGRACATLHEALMSLETVVCDDVSVHVRRLFGALVSAVLSGISPTAKDRVLAELGRWEPHDPSLSDLAALVKADLDVLRWGGRAGESARSLCPFEDAALETRRQAVRIAAARRVSVASTQHELAEIARWTGRTGYPGTTRLDRNATLR
jgi:serine/threonine protein kinase